MSTSDDRRLRALVEQVRDLAPSARDAALADLCDDDRMRRMVVEMLQAEPILPFERLGDYRLIRELGRGGMGIVYLAEEEPLGRLVALKIMPSHIAISAQRIARFQAEARAAAKLQHASIVPIYRFGETDGVHYIAFKFIDGDTLGERLRRLRSVETQTTNEEAPTPWVSDPAGDDGDAPRTLTPAARDLVHSREYLATCATLIGQIADALEHAHAHGVVHRDVKPGNILVDRDRRAHLADFGLARNDDDPTITRTGDIAGTYSYMSPEQALARRVRIDHRTDLFSLGVVLYEMLTLSRPFAGRTSHQVLYAITFKEPPSLRRLNSSVPRDLAVICSKALEKDPDDRYARAADMATDLRCFLEGRPIEIARPLSTPQRVRRAARRHRRGLAAAALAVVALLVGVLVPLRRDPGPARGTFTLRLVDPDTGAALAGTIGARRIDERTRRLGPVVPLGDAPVTDAPLAPGYWRIVAAAPGRGTAEVPWDLGADEHAALDLPVRRTEAVVADMIHLPSIDAIVGFESDRFVHVRRRTEFVPALAIDATEVTCADYARYVAQTDAPPPPLWDGPTPPPGWAARPVVGVTWTEARAYALWAGKRLPTDIEWERAAGAGVGLDMPWGSGPIESADWANFNPGDRANERLLPQAVAPRSGPIAVTDPDDAGGRASRSPDERPRLRDLVDRWVLPVRPLAPGSRDRTRDGVLGMAGNVREWTETMAFPMLSSDDPVAREHRCSKGYAWTMPLEPDMHLMTLHREHRDDRLITLGFRCVKSVDPFAPDPRPHDDTISSGD